MLPTAFHKLGLAAMTFAIWALGAGSAAYWGLKISAHNQSASAVPVGQDAVGSVDSSAVSRALGAVRVENASAVLAPVVGRYSLTGVAAVSASGQRGVALIAIDGKPARPYRVGAVLEDGVLLQSVEARRATLGATTNGAVLAVLELPAKK